MPVDSAFLERLSARLGPRGLVTAAPDIAPWLTDWRGRFSGAAIALAEPADTAEVAATVRLAAEAGVPIVPQGGNTSMVGGATPDASGTALLLSLRRLTAIRAVSRADASLVAGAGAILANVHDAAAAIDCRFPLSLAAKGSATIGGLIATNAGGTQVLRFGTMRALVLGVEAVLPDGSVIDGLATLRKDNRGYDLKQLLIGSEGTLGIVTAASLRLVPAIAERSVSWAAVRSPEDALALLRDLQARSGEVVESFELVAGDALALVLRYIPGTRAPLAGAHPWHVLIEIAGRGAAEIAEAALADATAAGAVEDAALAASEAQAHALWALRESISEAERIDGAAAKHDISVSVADMPGFIVRAAAQVEAAFPHARVLAFGHLGDGNIHFNVRAPDGADSQAWLRAAGPAVSAFVHDLVTAAGGSISAEHGIGQMKRAEFARLVDPVRLAAMRRIKAAFDPLGIMNPGKLLPDG